MGYCTHIRTYNNPFPVDRTILPFLHFVLIPAVKAIDECMVVDHGNFGILKGFVDLVMWWV
jgi:hypothetical protein